MGDNFEGKVEGGAARPTGMKGRAALKRDEMLDMTNCTVLENSPVSRVSAVICASLR